jgi:hypothetical protein
MSCNDAGAGRVGGGALGEERDGSWSVPNRARRAELLLSLARALDERHTYKVCFTLGQDRAGLVVDEVQAVMRLILVQAYSFTSVSLAPGAAAP